MTKITLKQLEQNLQKSENKLKPLEKGDYIGRVIRQIDAGWDKFIHLFTQRKWISRQEFELKKLQKNFDSLNAYYQKLNSPKELDRSKAKIIKNLSLMQTICGHIQKKVHEKKLSQSDIISLEKKIKELIQDCQKEEIKNESTKPRDSKNTESEPNTSKTVVNAEKPSSEIQKNHETLTKIQEEDRQEAIEDLEKTFDVILNRISREIQGQESRLPHLPVHVEETRLHKIHLLLKNIYEDFRALEKYIQKDEVWNNRVLLLQTTNLIKSVYYALDKAIPPNTLESITELVERIFPTGNKIEEMGKSSQLEKEKPTYQLPPERIHLRDSLIKERLDVLKHFRDKRKKIPQKIEKKLNNLENIIARLENKDEAFSQLRIEASYILKDLKNYFGPSSIKIQK